MWLSKSARRYCMQIEEYERLELTVTEFDVEDTISTSGISGGTTPDLYEGNSVMDFYDW